MPVRAQLQAAGKHYVFSGKRGRNSQNQRQETETLHLVKDDAGLVPAVQDHFAERPKAATPSPARNRTSVPATSIRTRTPAPPNSRHASRPHAAATTSSPRWSAYWINAAACVSRGPLAIRRPVSRPVVHRIPPSKPRKCCFLLPPK